MPKLLLDSDEEDNSGSAKLTINENYATAYERWRRKEEYQKLKDKYGEEILSEDSVASADEDDEDSDESDDSSDVDETIFDQQFLKVYGALKARDPEVYDEKVRFFDKEDEKGEAGDDEETPKESKKSKSSKGMNLLKYHMDLVTKEKGITEEDREMEAGEYGLGTKERPDSKSYVQELESIKKEFKSILNEDEEDGDDLIKGIKKVAPVERKPDPVEILREGSQKDKRIGFLANYWEKKDLDDREKFLKDYILEKKYLDPADREEKFLSSRLSSKGELPTSQFASSSSNAYANVNEDADEDEDEDDSESVKPDKGGMQMTSKLVTEKATAYHFQETDPEVIKRYPREIESVRNLTSATARNAKRSEVKERKTKEKQEALQRFRDLRRAEVKEKLAKLKEISGNDRLLDENQIDIDTIVDDISNFDPEKYDSCMSKLFDEQFYSVSHKTKMAKPKFDFVPGIDDVDDNLNPISGAGEGSSGEAAEEEEDIDGYGDEDEDEDGPSTSKGKKNKKRENKKKTEKSPAEKKNIGIYEDLIAGEVPTRFRYRSVPANDFGLSPEELLFADDKELNSWVSLKKTCQHRTDEEEKYDIKVYGRKANDYSLKKKILKSIYDPTKADPTEGQAYEDEDEDDQVQQSQQSQPKRPNESTEPAHSSNRRNPNKRGRFESRELEKANLTADRLRSYDLPFRAIKKLKSRLHREQKVEQKAKAKRRPRRKKK